MSYGGGVNFARYRRPEMSKFKYKGLKANNSYNFSHDGKYSAYSNRSHHKGSHSIDHGMNDKSARLSNHHKNLSHGNILDVNTVNRNSPQNRNNASSSKRDELGYDYEAYKSYDHAIKPQNDTIEVLPKSRQGPPKGDSRRVSKSNINHTISYDHPEGESLPNMQAPRKSESPQRMQRSTSNIEKGRNEVQDSLENHIYNTLSGAPSRDVTSRVAQKDVERQSIEQDRYYSRLNKMNSKQLHIFEKYLVDQLVPAKDKEKHLEELEKKKREEARERFDVLDKGSKNHKTALKREYKKYLNNQMKQREKERDYESQMKKETLAQMKNFAAMEVQKDKLEKKSKVDMQNAYRSALQSQEYLKSKQQLHDQTKLHKTGYGGSPDAVYTFGGTFSNVGSSRIEKGYIPPNPIVNPVSDPMYNPYFRKDIIHGMNEIGRSSPS